MSMIDMIRKEEERIAQLEKELAEEGKRIEERKAKGERMNSYRYMDLKRSIRKKKREVRRAKDYLETAQRRKEIAAGERMTVADMIAEARRMKDGQDQTK